MFILLSASFVVNGYAVEENSSLPEWVRNNFVWYGQNEISEKDLLNVIQYLIDEGIINSGYKCGLGTEPIDGICQVADTPKPPKNSDYDMIEGTTYLKPVHYESFASSPFFDQGNNNPNFTVVDFDNVPLNDDEVTSLYNVKPSSYYEGTPDSVFTGTKGVTHVVPGNIAEFILHPDSNNDLPTHVGIVFTDSVCSNKGGKPIMLSFEAFGPDQTSLKKMNPEKVGDNGRNGEINEDRFFGVVFPQGISKIKLTADYNFDDKCTSPNSRMEFDHLQYGRLS